MAIHDVGKDTPDRDNPQPNAHDLQGVERAALGTQSFNPTTDATSVTGYVQTKNGRMLVNDGTTNRIVIGVLPDGTLGIVISKSGTDVLSLF